jgi:hypothetical protein
VNCSFAVDAIDALEVVRYLALAPPAAQCIGKGFVNCDQVLNQIDALVILRYTADLPLGLPAGCGGVG